MSVLYGERTGGGVYGRFAEVVAFRQQNKPLMMMLMNFARRRPPEELQQRLGALHAEQNRQIEAARDDPHLAERHDVLAMLVQASHDDGSPLSNDEIRDHLMTIIVQGHTPTAVTMAWVMERLVRHPEWLERVRAEADTDSDENLDAVITETLRLRHSAGPFMGRRVAQTFRFGPYELPPGLLVGTNAYALHRRPELYQDPHTWRPERWFGQKPGFFTYIPFGGGDRHCIGRDFAMYEMKLVLRAMLRQFRFAPSNAPGEKSMRRGTSWIPKDGAQMLIAERIPAPSPQQPAVAPPTTS
jgi:cytochrome P450